jgi:cytosine/uracil/thiamine/allantoin permease
VKATDVPNIFHELHILELYNYAWFVGFAVAFVVYLIGRQLTSRHSQS